MNTPRLANTEPKVMSENFIGPPPVSSSFFPLADTVSRFLVAFFGGAFLLAPMYNLTYVRDQKLQLVSVVIWVLVFSGILAAFDRLSNQELLSATAAYAAVLIVFISQGPGST